jgi:hypothetical protein
MTTTARARYKGHRFPAEIIGHAVWLYFRFPLGLRMVEELLAARGIMVSHETVRQWARKFDLCRGSWTLPHHGSFAPLQAGHLILRSQPAHRA